MILREYKNLGAPAVIKIRDTLRQINWFRHKTNTSVKLSLDQYYRMSISNQERQFFKFVLHFFWSSVLPKTYEELFKREPMLILDLCKFRAQRPQPSHGYTPWHLDANFYGFDVPMLTAWMPLVDVGVNAPGLEFRVPRRTVSDSEIRTFWESIPRNDGGGRSIDDDRIPELFGADSRLLAPVLTIGSCVIFDQHALHRTQILDGATNSREAIEFRIVAADEAPDYVMGGGAADLLGARYDRSDNRITISKLASLFPELSGESILPH